MVVDSTNICHEVEVSEYFLIASPHNQWLLILISVEQHSAGEYLIAMESPVMSSNYISKAIMLL